MKQLFAKKKQVYLPVLRYLLVAACFLPFRSWAQTVTLKVKDAPVKKVFDEVAKQTGYTFFYDENLLSKANPVTADLKKAALKTAMDELCNNQPFTYAIESKIIIITFITDKRNIPRSDSTINSGQKEGIVTGRIISKDGLSLAGASLVVKGKSIAGTTDENGHYSIAADANDQLIISYVNYKQEIISIKKRKVIDVVLEPSNNTMETVVISNGYQKIEQKHLTGSVTRLKMDSIMQPGFTTVDKMLEGRVPGMIMMQNSGQVGAVPRLRIRGTSTILGTREPLWVVDGIVRTDPVPIPASQLNDLEFVNLIGNAISGINPYDIESIDILKDAAATALYGVRAANGVIVVTTKRGKAGPPSILYNNTISVTRRPRYTDNDVYMMNSQERIDVSREMFAKQIPVTGVPEAYEKALLDYYGGKIDYNTLRERLSRAEQMNTDWLGIVTQDVISANHALSISGGNPLSKYYASVGYTNNRGVIKGEYEKRYTGQLSYNLDYRKLKTDFNITFNRSDRRYSPGEIGVMNFAYATSRAIPLYNEDGTLHYFAPSTTSTNPITRPSFNIINEMDRSGQTIEGNEFAATAKITYELMRGLQLETILNYTASNTEERNWNEEKTNVMDVLRGPLPDNPNENPYPFGGRLKQNSNRQRNFTVGQSVNFNHFVDGGKKHLISGFLRGEIYSTKNSGMSSEQPGYYPERGHTFAVVNIADYPAYGRNLASKVPIISEMLTNRASLALSGSYVFDERYVISGNAMTAFSNAFGQRSNEKFNPTWGLSARWNIDRDLLKNVKWVDRVALRISYGTVGAMRDGETPYTIIRKGAFDSWFQSFTSKIKSYPNPNLKWEKTDDYNVGLEFSLFGGKLNGDVAVFYKKTTNAFMDKRISIVNGREVYVVNGGVLENKGIDLALNFTPVNQTLGRNNKKFVWKIDPQFGQIFNRLLQNATRKKVADKLVDDAVNFTYQNYLDGTVLLDDKPINTFYSYRFKGLNGNGQPVFYGAEPENAAELKERFSKMSPQEIFSVVMEESGRREPVLQGGISSYVRYGSWMLSVNFAYSVGNKIRLLQIASGNYGTYRPSSQQNLRKEYVNRWRYPGDEAKTNIPGLNSPSNISNRWWDSNLFALDYFQMYDNSDLRVVSGDYIKLQSAKLVYNCTPEQYRLLHLKDATLTLSGTNLFTWANKDLRGQDPTQSGSGPNINLGLRPQYSFTISVNL
ncbi:SusC/RagA family TonB-linked outer membrane protein [Pseudoflavitalea sp. G-6-1-2]|uniref:SusC/RagA family TonB-linked outer membrane protein n=1 Tax=Pseudoflavitalea sp. G-6-1-2 TaxID=2728841 RepID=UPI00146E3F06|nr:SusC/RagA family TonB-linked outer membrane protein [Pseudoflavitalea sp. G-6-1-2]NML21168.1 SusC/RagA family TonB-linked outer membrane protein [Pseudoflavitalea sp. G-6-1-2]